MYVPYTFKYTLPCISICIYVYPGLAIYIVCIRYKSVYENFLYVLFDKGIHSSLRSVSFSMQYRFLRTIACIQWTAFVQTKHERYPNNKCI